MPELAVGSREGFDHVKILRRHEDASFQWSLDIPARFTTGFVACADLDSDGTGDLIANTSGEFYVFLNRTLPAASTDGNHNQIPDECEARPRFHRGDVNDDGILDISDGLCVLKFLFEGARRPSCLESSDANNDGSVDCSDSIMILGYLFLGSPPPQEPGPPPAPCGLDSDPAGTVGDLGCSTYEACGS
jgi:hypothetical protein